MPFSDEAVSKEGDTEMATQATPAVTESYVLSDLVCPGLPLHAGSFKERRANRERSRGHVKNHTCQIMPAVGFQGWRVSMGSLNRGEGKRSFSGLPQDEEK